MQIEKNKSLLKLNSFGFDQKAERYIEIDDAEKLTEIVEYANHQHWPIFILGGGSNLVLTRGIKGLVIRLTNQTLRYENRGAENSWLFRLVAGAGANWHNVVRDSTSRGLTGLENLSLIPGSVGAAPVQNIGAYGVELSDRFESLRALHLPSNQWHTFTKSDCEFGYRDSIFKRMKNEYAIFTVNLMLGNDMPFNMSYDSLQSELASFRKHELNSGIISDAIVRIRQSKLPDPETLGNAGSFFQNPVLTEDEFLEFRRNFPTVAHFVQTDNKVKLSAGWLIESLGYKGYRVGSVGVYQKQALVLVNYASGSGNDIIDLAQEIQRKVTTAYNIHLTIEPDVL